MNKLLILFAATLIFSSCEREEKLYPEPFVPVGIQTATFAMGENYANQLWFEFSTQKTASNPFGLWDIAFASDASNRIIINGGKHNSFGIAAFPGKDFKDICQIDAGKTDWAYDNPKGDPDSLAFSGWFDMNGPGKALGKDVLYILNRGADSLGNKKFIKLKIISREGGVYHFQWGTLTDTIPVFDIYQRVNTDYNYSYYSFSFEKEVYNEPFTNDNWDIVFTTYKQNVYEESFGIMMPYVLRGVLVNPKNVKVCELYNKIAFEKIDLTYALNQTYSDYYNEIGYDWKLWNMTANKYTVDQNRIYLIRDNKGNYFKMKIVDFYDDQGRKGFPKLAWELLK